MFVWPVYQHCPFMNDPASHLLTTKVGHHSPLVGTGDQHILCLIEYVWVDFQAFHLLSNLCNTGRVGNQSRPNLIEKDTK